MGIPYVITVHDGWWISKHQFLLDDDDNICFFDFRRLSDRPSNSSDNKRSQDGMPGAAGQQLASQSRLWGARAVLAVSEPFAEIYRNAGVPNVLALPNGVSRLPEVRRVPASDHRVRLGQIGGMARHKGFHLIKYALLASEFRNLSLTVVDLSRGRDYRSYATWGTTPVTFVGKFAQSDTADLYGMIDILLAPSVWPESFGLVTREALACGCWVVASNRGAVGEPVVEGVNGHIVDVADINGLTSILRQIDGNPGKYRRPPEYSTPLRRSTDQADDLAALYLKIVEETGGGTASGAE
jgi:glycosyltransferase involved in cell wall biosynthesis